MCYRLHKCHGRTTQVTLIRPHKYRTTFQKERRHLTSPYTSTASRTQDSISCMILSVHHHSRKTRLPGQQHLTLPIHPSLTSGAPHILNLLHQKRFLHHLIKQNSMERSLKSMDSLKLDLFRLPQTPHRMAQNTRSLNHISVQGSQCWTGTDEIF